jgi:low affinity Fe/Cu permease
MEQRVHEVVGLIMRIGSNFMETLAGKCSAFAGSSPAFSLAVLLVLVWAASGPIFHYSEIWQLVINTGTTIITFLMVFLIQRAQNKDILSIHAKLNELIAAHKGASNKLINIENATEAELIALKREFERLSGPDDTGTESKSISHLSDNPPAA